MKHLPNGPVWTPTHNQSLFWLLQTKNCSRFWPSVKNSVLKALSLGKTMHVGTRCRDPIELKWVLEYSRVPVCPGRITFYHGNQSLFSTLWFIFYKRRKKVNFTIPIAKGWHDSSSYSFSFLFSSIFGWLRLTDPLILGCSLTLTMEWNPAFLLVVINLHLINIRGCRCPLSVKC